MKLQTLTIIVIPTIINKAPTSLPSQDKEIRDLKYLDIKEIIIF